MADRYYPSRSDFPTHEQFDAHRQTLDQLYALQDELATARQEITKANQQIAKLKQSNIGQGNSLINTTLNGVSIKSVPPKDGQTLKYVASSNQIEWT